MENTRMNVGQRLWKVVVNPYQAFRAIKEDPRFLIPASLILVIMVAATVLVAPETSQYSAELMIRQGVPADQIEATQKMLMPMAIVGVLAGFAFIWLLQAIALTIYNQIALGEGRFKQFLAVAIISSVPIAILQVISTVLLKATGVKAAMQINTSLSLLLNSENQNFLYRFLSKFDLFVIWGLILLAIGGATVMNKSVKGVAIYILILWVVISIAMALLGGLYPTPAV